MGPKAKTLACEGNYYYDVSKCGIGFHGDSERKRVIGLRLGASIPLHYQWFQKSVPIGQRYIVELDHGDLYIMSEKAVGQDWLLRSKLTLRHAAGSKTYTTIKKQAITEDPAVEEKEEVKDTQNPEAAAKTDPLDTKMTDENEVSKSLDEQVKQQARIIMAMSERIEILEGKVTGRGEKFNKLQKRIKRLEKLNRRKAKKRKDSESFSAIESDSDDL